MGSALQLLPDAETGEDPSQQVIGTHLPGDLAFGEVPVDAVADPTLLDRDQGLRVQIEHRPEVVLLDVHLPGGGGVEVMRRSAPRCPETRFLALSVSDAAEDVIGTIRGGARGYVTKSITGSELGRAEISRGTSASARRREAR